MTEGTGAESVSGAKLQAAYSVPMPGDLRNRKGCLFTGNLFEEAGERIELSI